MWNNIDQRGSLPVFYVDPVGGHRGMHYYDFELCSALRSAGVDVTLLTSDETLGTDMPPSLRVEFPFQGIYGSTAKLARGLRYMQGLLRVGRLAKRRRIPLVHFHYCHFPPLDWLYIKWLHWTGVSLIFTAHDVIPFDAGQAGRDWLRRIYHEVDRIIVHAESSRAAVVQAFDVPVEHVRVIPMGPYLHFAEVQHQPAPLAKGRLGLEPETPVVLFFGQIKRVKGIQYLIRAFREVVRQCPDARLVIAGPEWKDSFSTYGALVDELGLSDYVLARVEYVPDEEVGTYFSAADVVALPYTESYQSAVLYMAFSFARAVVASAVGGFAEVIEEGVTGLLVPPADVDRLADALLALLQDREKASAMGENGRKLVESRYGWAEIARKTAAVYAEALAQRERIR